MSELLTAKQVADLTGVVSQTVRKWARRGQIPFTRDALGWRRFRPEDVHARVEVTEATLTPLTQLDRMTNRPEPVTRRFDPQDTDEI